MSSIPQAAGCESEVQGQGLGWGHRRQSRQRTAESEEGGLWTGSPRQWAGEGERSTSGTVVFSCQGCEVESGKITERPGEWGRQQGKACQWGVGVGSVSYCVKFKRCGLVDQAKWQLRMGRGALLSCPLSPVYDAPSTATGHTWGSHLRWVWSYSHRLLTKSPWKRCSWSQIHVTTLAQYWNGGLSK